MKKTYKKIEEKLTSEGTELRQPVAELETLETDHKQAEQPLGKAEEDKLAILDSISELVVLQDLEHRMVWTNKAAAESVGLTAAQLVGRYCYEIWPQRSQPCAGCPVAKARQTGKPQKAEIATPDGRTWSVRGYPILDANDRVTGMIELALDITERKQASEALADEATRRHILVDQSLDGIVVLDENAKVYEANQKFAEMLGYTPEEVRELHTWDWDTQWSREELLEMGRKVDETGFQVETYHRRKDGSTIDVEISVNGAVIAGQKLIFCVCRNITERKQAEEKLNESEEKYKELAESITNVFFAFDKDLRYTYWNKASEQLTGISAEDALGKHLYDIFPDSEMTKMAERGYLKALRTQQVQSFVNEYHIGGKDYFFEISAYPSKNGLSVFARDITEHKKTEDILRISERDLAEAQELAHVGNWRWEIIPDEVHWSDEAYRLFGMEPGETVNYAKYLSIVLPEDRDFIMKEVQDALDGIKPYENEHRILRNGEIQIHHTKGTVTQDEQGKPIRLFGVVQDITDRKKAEEKLQTILKTALDGFWLTNLEGKLLEVNDSYCKMVGYTRKELLKMSISDLEAIESPRGVTQHIKRITEQGFDSFESRHKRKDGKIIDVEISVNYLDVGEGQLFVFARDITERKQAEQTLRDSEEKTRKMFESVSCGISVVDLNGVITEVNRRTLEIHSLGSKDEILGKNAFDIVAPRDRDKIARNMLQALKRGTVRDQEYTLLRSDGSEFPAELSTSVLKDSSGKAIGHITIARDITKRKQAEEALQSEKNKLQSLIDALGDDLGIQDKDYNIIYQNEPSKAHFGDRLGEKCYRAYEGKDKVSDDCPVKKAFKDGKSHTSEREVITPSGEVTYWENTANPIRDASGEIVACIEVGRNITERKQAEQREKELQKELLLSSRLAAIGELAAGVAHQLNNPLTGVLGFSQRMLRKSTDEEASRNLERIHTEAERAAKVVHNLLTFARRRQPHKQYSDTNEILESALELRAYELKTSNIKVITNLAPGLPEVMVDFHQIEEVFLNIILNAEQAMTEANSGGKLTIKTEERKEYIRTTFTDDGPGIPAEHLDKIFDPFYTTKGEKGGTGLGLSVCHGIITEHGGKIYARSKPGKGTTFFTELPLTHK